MKIFEYISLKIYREMCREHTTNKIKNYDYEKLRESYDEFETIIINY